MRWKVLARLYWDLPTSLSLFLKSEKIPAMFCFGKGPEYRPFRDFRPVPSAYGPRAQISNHGMAHALLLYKMARGQRIDIYYLES